VDKHFNTKCGIRIFRRAPFVSFARPSAAGANYSFGRREMLKRARIIRDRRLAPPPPVEGGSMGCDHAFRYV
jgi:hypothetical protein